MVNLRFSGHLRSLAARGAAPFFGSVVSAETREPLAALTFDDGPDPVSTPILLDVLKRHNAKATFFMIGERAATYPAFTKRIQAEGHEMGNHSWDHPSFPLISCADLRYQLRRTERELGGTRRLLMRPPFGHQGIKDMLTIKWLGYTTVAWSFHVEDWLDHDAPSLVRKMAMKMRPGVIVLLHDGLHVASGASRPDRSATIAAVDALLSEFSHYEFVTVSELLSRGKPVRKLRMRYP